MEKVNSLDFAMLDPVDAGEEWAKVFGAVDKVVEIYIDGERLLDTIREIEKPYAKEEGCLELAGDYGHVSPQKLYFDLRAAAEKNGYLHDSGAYLYCCAECGEVGCWSVTVKIKEDDRFVYWYEFEQEHRPWEYNLTFRFEKDSYKRAMQKLYTMSLQQKR